MRNTSGSFHLAEGELRKTQELSPEDDEHARGEAVIAVFHNDELVLQDGTLPISVPDDDESSRIEGEQERRQTLDSSTLLQVKPRGVEKLALQYKLQSRESQDTQILQYLDVDKLLKGDRIWNWSFEQDHKFNPIFRRHLEHILCVCLVNVMPIPHPPFQYAFISDFTFESGSSALNDL